VTLHERRLPFALAALLLALPQDALAPPIVVDNTTCTLVDAVEAANTDAPVGGCPAGSGADTIELTGDVVLTEAIDTGYPQTGLPIVTDDLRVKGAGFTIERDPDASDLRFWTVSSRDTLELDEVVLRNGSAGLGGAIMVFSHGHLILTNSTISNNAGFFSGGAIMLQPDAWLTMTDSTISSNSAPFGGGIYARSDADLNITNSTISGNSATFGGGLNLRDAALAMSHSTVSGNSAESGGGGLEVRFDYYYGDVLLSNVTIAANTGFGINFTDNENALYFDIRRSIVADNTAGDCGGLPFTSVTDSFSSAGDCGEGFEPITGLDPTLADNGGPTRTHALSPTSSAIDATACSAAADQRGLPRQDGACDSGAFEFQCTLSLAREMQAVSIHLSADSSTFDVVTGSLFDLLSDGDFSRATCMGTYSTSPIDDPDPDPGPGDGRYYLASCENGYGSSSVGDPTAFPPIPDPRDALSSGPCP